MIQRIVASAASGALWGGLAWMLAPPSLQRAIDFTVTLLLAPLIGVAVGEVVRLFTERHFAIQAAVSVVLLYLATTLFAVLLQIQNPGFEGVGLFLGGLTYFFLWLLGPLALANCQLIWWIDERQRAAARARR